MRKHCTVIRKAKKPNITNNEALNMIATLLGANAEWDVEMLESIAIIVGETGRPFPGDQSDTVLAMYRRAADRMDIEHDGGDDE